MQITSELEELIYIEEIASDVYSLEKSKAKAVEFLESISEKGFNFNFEDNIWNLPSNVYVGFIHRLNFNKLEMISRKNKINIVDLVKCWSVELLESCVTSTVRGKVNLLIPSILMTDFFSKEKVHEFTNYLSEEIYDSRGVSFIEKVGVNESKNHLNNVHKVLNTINSVLSFINYLDFPEHEPYILELLNLRNKIPKVSANRILPKSKDVLTLNNCIENYFEKGFISNERIHFSPILIWWRLTNVIPIRMGEFCNTVRGCTWEEEGIYYIKLPRIKNLSSPRRLQTLDTIAINEEMYKLIREYIRATDSYGSTKTLISWKAINETGSYIDRTLLKKAPEHINNVNFTKLLEAFYRDVVKGKYEKEYEREVNPNDTRHFAFCSLLMQGISPVEIARLGGHTSVETQYFYSNHTEYFIDMEVKKIMDSYKVNDGQISSSTISGNEFSIREVEAKSFNYPKNDTRLQMKIGYCTDEFQICESDECMLCSKWWISPHELLSKKELIETKIASRKQKIFEISAFLKSLNENITTTLYKNGLKQEELEILATKSNEAKSHLLAIARFKQLQGEVHE